MPAPDSVLKLCETFTDHRDHYRSGSYNEAQLRREFLDPFFAALGWDMDNTQGHAPQYRDVIHEDALRVGPHVKAPDYAFTLQGSHVLLHLRSIPGKVGRNRRHLFQECHSQGFFRQIRGIQQKEKRQRRSGCRLLGRNRTLA